MSDKSPKGGLPGSAAAPARGRPSTARPAATAPADGARRLARLRERLARLGAPRRSVRVAGVELMLAETRQRPFSGGDWIFELKYDGFRLLVAREDGRPVLRYRGGATATAAFPEIARAVAALPFGSFVMDGEVVVVDGRGRPNFQRLQRRAQLARPLEIERASVETPATVQLFDLLQLEGFDLRSRPLRDRKALLREILRAAAAGGPLRYTDHVEEHGERLFAEVERHELEGIVAKKKASRYHAGRSSDWLKIRRERAGDFTIVGYTEPRRGRSGLGAVHVATVGERGLRYAGRVGSGFDEDTLGRLREELEPLRREECPCAGAAPKGRENVWVEPRLVCEVRYTEWTEEGLLRQPVFLRLRDERRAAERRAIPFTNLEKTFWPNEGYTKGDLVEFYRRVSPWLLPYLRDRPLVLTRFPDGVDGKSFYQKDAPGHVPSWIRRERMWSEHAGREIDYFVCDDLESLLYLVNLGTIPLHLWSSRVGSLETPDWCVLDLDPKGAPFGHVVRVALAIRRLCAAIRLPVFLKTSGSTGLHVLVPLGAQCTHEESRWLGELLSRVVAEELPDIATTVRRVGDRGGKVYLDYLQNRKGQTIAAPFSVRPLPGAPVSTPLHWRELSPRFDPRKLTMRTLPARLDEAWRDPMREVLTCRPDLGPALARLGERLGRAARERAARPRR